MGDDTYNNSYEDTPVTESDFNEGFNEDPEFDEPDEEDDDDED